MLLIDRLAQSKLMATALGPEHWADFRAVLDKTMKFVLTKEVSAAAQRTKQSSARTILDARALCRAPYRYLWIECHMEDRGAFDEPEPDPGRVVSEVGCLLISAGDTLQRGSAFLAWCDGERQPVLSPLMMAYDFTDSNQLEPLNEQYFHRTRDTILAEVNESYVTPRMRKDIRADPEATLALENRAALLPTPFHADFYRLVAEKYPDPLDLTVQHFLDEWRNDWRGELLFFQVAIMFLNSKNSVAIEFNDLSRLNKKRRRFGRAALYSHKVVQLSLTGTQENRTRMMTAAEARAHLVRGHFKIRKNGVFWWMPHIRGNRALGFVDKDYEVVP